MLNDTLSKLKKITLSKLCRKIPMGAHFVKTKKFLKTLTNLTPNHTSVQFRGPPSIRSFIPLHFRSTSKASGFVDKTHQNTIGIIDKVIHHLFFDHQYDF
jgi:hypothetical protein